LGKEIRESEDSISLNLLVHDTDAGF